MFENIKKNGGVYFVGSGGVSMSALCKLLYGSGVRVGGYDRHRSEYTDTLALLGIQICFKTSDVDLNGFGIVVYSDAVPLNNPIISAAAEAGKIVLSRGEFLAKFCTEFKRTLAVAGCHGKTTCVAMLAHIFAADNRAFCVHLGGIDFRFGNSAFFGRDFFITEACEYKRNFLKLSPDLAIILNSGADHLDCYGTPEEVKKAYDEFAANAKSTIRLFGDGASEISFGLDNKADYYVRNIHDDNGKYSYTAYENGVRLGTISLGVYGKHNVLNSLAALAAARKFGISFEKIYHGLSDFEGVKRRFERIGFYNGAECIADYAHHPDEIKAALKTARRITRGRVFMVFQPHTYSRTKSLFERFVDVLATQKKLLIYKTFAAREYYDDAGSALTLSRALKRSVYGDSSADILQFLADATENDTVLFLGAGDIYQIALKIIADS